MGGWYSVRTGGRPGTCILAVLIMCSHAFMDFSYFPHNLMLNTTLKYKTNIYKTLKIVSDINIFIFKVTNHNTKTIKFSQTL